MGIAFDFKSILLLHLTYLLRNANSNYYDPFYQPPEQDYPTQEDTSDMDHGHDHHHHHERSDHNYNHDHEYEAEGKMRRYSYEEDDCYSCACNKCDNPPECCKQVCESCPKRPLIPPPQMQMPGAPMTMPQMSMPMPNMQMTMPQMPMQMPQTPLSSSFSGAVPGQNLVFFPFSPNFMNLLKQITPPEVKKEDPPVQTTTEATTTTTEAPTTTTRATTTTITTPPPAQPASEEQVENLKHHNNPYFRNRYDNNMLESVLKGNIDEFSNIIMKSPEKGRNEKNKYMLTALRRTKPTWMPKFGIVPISDNMAEKLMSQLRDVKGIRRRPKRMAVFLTE